MVGRYLGFIPVVVRLATFGVAYSVLVACCGKASLFHGEGWEPSRNRRPGEAKQSLLFFVKHVGFALVAS